MDRGGPYLSLPLSPFDASCGMLLTPTLALLSIIFNFCALSHVTSNWNSFSNRRWQTLDHVIYAIEEATTTVYESYLDIVTPPPLVSPPVYFSPLRHAEWVYRSSAVRILDLVDGSSRMKIVSDVDSPLLLSSSPPKSAGPIASAGILPPTLTASIYPATFEQFPTYKPSTQLLATCSAIQFLGLIWPSLLGYIFVFALLKVGVLRSPPLYLLLNAP